MVATGFRYGSKASAVWDSVDLSAFSDEGALDVSIDTAETTTFGVTYKTFIEGLAASKFTLKGKFDPTTTTGPAAALTSRIGGGSKSMVYSPAGTVSLELKRTFNCILTSYQETSPVGGVVTFSASFQGTGTVVFGAN